MGALLAVADFEGAQFARVGGRGLAFCGFDGSNGCFCVCRCVIGGRLCLRSGFCWRLCRGCADDDGANVRLCIDVECGRFHRCFGAVLYQNLFDQ